MCVNCFALTMFIVNTYGAVYRQSLKIRERQASYIWNSHSRLQGSSFDLFSHIDCVWFPANNDYNLFLELYLKICLAVPKVRRYRIPKRIFLDQPFAFNNLYFNKLLQLGHFTVLKTPNHCQLIWIVATKWLVQWMQMDLVCAYTASIMRGKARYIWYLIKGFGQN